jgi:fatty-acyl-CoA synthase
MAEVGLGISFSALGEPLRTDSVDRDRCADRGEAEAATPASGDHLREFVVCGAPLPGYEVEIRNEQGAVLPERRVGELFVRGPSIMQGYLDEPEATAAVLTDGWLDTGDLGYRIGAELVLTGRRKDLIIINGRNIWPQDLELIAEGQGVRSGSAAAFAVHSQDAEQVVLVVECRNPDPSTELSLVKGIRAEVRAEFGVDCTIVATEPRTLPRTSSGKLSRVRARQMYENGDLRSVAPARVAGD